MYLYIDLTKSIMIWTWTHDLIHTHTQTTWVAFIKKNEVCIKGIAQVNFFFVQLKSLHLMIILSPGIKENM